MSPIFLHSNRVPVWRSQNPLKAVRTFLPVFLLQTAGMARVDKLHPQRLRGPTTADWDPGSNNADLGIFSFRASRRSVTRLIVGTPRVAGEGGTELIAREVGDGVGSDLDVDPMVVPPDPRSGPLTVPRDLDMSIPLSAWPPDSSSGSFDDSGAVWPFLFYLQPLRPSLVPNWASFPNLVGLGLVCFWLLDSFCDLPPNWTGGDSTRVSPSELSVETMGGG
ncbi:hypothetical protein U1Q18_007509 [Sarracenia purpurea var. burkii]